MRRSFEGPIVQFRNQKIPTVVGWISLKPTSYEQSGLLESFRKLEFVRNIFPKNLFTGGGAIQVDVKMFSHNISRRKKGSYGSGGSSSSASSTIAGVVVGMIIFIILVILICYRYGLCAKLIQSVQKQPNENPSNNGSQVPNTTDNQTITTSGYPPAYSYSNTGKVFQNAPAFHATAAPQNQFYTELPVTGQ